jgi:hypothetical protein
VPKRGEKNRGFVFAVYLLKKKQNLPRAAEKTKRKTDVHLRQLAKKVRTYLLFSARFWAFLGKGSSKTRENN